MGTDMSVLSPPLGHRAQVLSWANGNIHPQPRDPRQANHRAFLGLFCLTL